MIECIRLLEEVMPASATLSLSSTVVNHVIYCLFSNMGGSTKKCKQKPLIVS